MFTEEKIGKVIIENYEALYTAIFFSVYKDKLQAEDITQDAVIKIIESLRAGKYKKRDGIKIGVWMIRIGVHLAVDFHRKALRIPLYEIETKLEGGKITERKDLRDYYYSETELNYEELIAYKDHIKELREIVRNLKFEQREVFILRTTFKYSFKEIAQRTNVSINTVLGRMRYSLRHIRRKLGINPVLVIKRGKRQLEIETCTKCKDDKLRKDFSRNKKRKSGINSWCKECSKKRATELRLKEKRA